MSLPTTMRFMDHGAGGAPEVITLKTGPVPTLKDSEVLVKVVYAGVNRPDCLQRMGLYPVPPGASPIMGLECSGEVVAVGPGVTTLKVGQQVCALTAGGSYAEFVAVEAGHCLPIPKGLSLEQAAALPENFFTVYHNVIERGALKSGERFLVHGGSSGIGLTAIQLAREQGAEVFTTAGSAEKLAVCKQYGATHALDYKTEDWAAAIGQASGGKGIDVILDMVGGPYVEKNLASLAVEGRLVFIAFLQGSKANVNFINLMVKRQVITGSTLRPRTNAEKSRLAACLLRDVWPKIEAGRVKPHLYKTFALEEATKAHALMESSAHIGKIMLKVA